LGEGELDGLETVVVALGGEAEGDEDRSGDAASEHHTAEAEGFVGVFLSVNGRLVGEERVEVGGLVQSLALVVAL